MVRTRAGIGAFAALLIGAILAFGTTSGAQAAATTQLTIHLATQSGAPFTGVAIAAIPVTDHEQSGDQIDFTPVPSMPGAYISGDNGATDLQQGQDYAIFFAPSSTSSVFSQYYGGAAYIEEAKLVTFASATAELNATLASHVSITGTVTSPTGRAMPGVHVVPYRFDGTGFFNFDFTPVVTNAAGAYTLTDLDPGSYKVGVEQVSGASGYLASYNGGSTTLVGAPSIYVGLGAATTVNVRMLSGGTLTGATRFTSGDGTTHYSPGIQAFAYPLLGPVGAYTGIDETTTFASNVTTSSGKWSIRGLPSGHYVVKVISGYVTDKPTYIGGGTTWNTATRFTVTRGSSTATPTVVLGHSVDELTVVVQDAQGVKLKDATVSVSNDLFHFSGTTLDSGETEYPDALAHFLLQPGTYDITVVFDPDQNGIPNLQPYQDTVVVGAQPVEKVVTLDTMTPFAFTTAASISNHATLTTGTVFTAVPGAVNNSGGNFSYQWYRDDKPIFGATSSTYQSRGGDLGRQLTVEVHASTFGWNDANGEPLQLVSTASVDAPLTIGDAPTNSAAPTITPSTGVLPGATLTARVGSWSQDGLNYAYDWRRDGASTGQSGNTYVVQKSDAGHSLSVYVNAQRAGFAPSSAGVHSTSVAVGFLPAPTQVAAPTVTSAITSTEPGGVTAITYTAHAGTYKPAATESNLFEWFVDGQSVDATVAYTPKAEDDGKAIELVEHDSQSGYAPFTSTRVVVRKGEAPLPSGNDVQVTNASAGNQDIAAAPGRVGDTLTAVDSAYSYPAPPASPGAQSTTYLWQRTDTMQTLQSGSSSRYTVKLADVGAPLRVVLTHHSAAYEDSTQTISAGTPVLRDSLVKFGGVTMVRSGTNLATITAVVTGLDAYTPTVRYQWFHCGACTMSDTTGAVPFTGATAAAFTIPSTNPSDLVYVRVTASKSTYATAHLLPTSPIDPQHASDFTVLSPPTINGDTEGVIKAGKRLTAHPGRYDRSGTSSYYWTLCEINAPDDCASNTSVWTDLTPRSSNFSTYTVKGADAVHPSRIRVVQVIRYRGTTVASGQSASTSTAPGDLVLTGAPSAKLLSGRYTVSTGTWSPMPAVPSFTYAWYLQGSQGSATGKQYPDPVSSGNSLYVIVTAHLAGFVDRSAPAVAVLGSAPSASGGGITGSSYGETLHAPTVVFTPPYTPTAEVTLTSRLAYRWTSNNVTIPGQTRSTFTPTSSYIGKAIRVVVTNSSNLFATAAFTSAPVTLAHGSFGAWTPGFTSTTSPPRPGTALRATSGISGVSGVSYAYRWQYLSGPTWKTLPSGTASTYTITSADVGRQLRLDLTASKSGYTTGEKVSGSTVVSAPLALTATALPSITGTSVGTVFTAHPPSWNTTGVAVGYQWVRNGIPLPGATSSTFTPLGDSLYDEVSVIVTGRKTGWTTTVLSSNILKPSRGAPPAAVSLPTASPGAADFHVGTPGTWSLSGLTFTYQWMLDGNAQPGETGTTYAGLHQGHAVSVLVTATRYGYDDGTAESIPLIIVP
ncbi:MAG: hypothetical protein QOI02_329 [Actinomycetota bacterium]|nr:hypothetical protein [Actinomycetota bacterium]